MGNCISFCFKICNINSEDENELNLNPPNKVQNQNKNQDVKSERIEDPTVPKPLLKICFECKGQDEEDEIMPLDCKKCFIGNKCIFKKFEKLLRLNQNSLFCSCKIPIAYPIFEHIVVKSDLIAYLGVISKSNNDLSKQICTCGNIINHRDSCNPDSKVCLKCLQPHGVSQTCLEYFKSKPSTKCNDCNEDLKKLKCGCFLCVDCNLSDIKSSILEDINNPKCPKCTKSLHEVDMEDFFKGTNKYESFLEKAKNSFKCLICYKNSQADDCVKIKCRDKFCKKCFKEFIKSSADSLPENSTIIKCPECSQEFSESLLKKYLEGNSLKRFNIKLWKCQAKDQNTMYCVDCDIERVVKKLRSKNKCENCERKICSKCHFVYSPTCCSSSVDIDAFGELKEFISFCPKCNAPVLKNDPNEMRNGCNFLKCSNNSCSQVYFCFLCKKILTVRFI